MADWNVSAVLMSTVGSSINGAPASYQTDVGDRHTHRHVDSYIPEDVYSSAKGDKLEPLPSSKAYFKHIDVVEIHHFSEARGKTS